MACRTAAGFAMAVFAETERAMLPTAMPLDHTAHLPCPTADTELLCCSPNHSRDFRFDRVCRPGHAWPCSLSHMAATAPGTIGSSAMQCLLQHVAVNVLHTPLACPTRDED